jgi:hypothetical protein
VNGLIYGQTSVKKSSLAVEMSPMITSSLKISADEVRLLQSKRLFSGEFGLGFEHQISSKWRFRSSLAFGLLPYDFHYDFAPPANSIFQTGPFKEDYTRLDINFTEYAYIRTYSSIDARWSRKVYATKSGNEWSIGTGLRLFVFLVNTFEYYYYSNYYIDDAHPNVPLFTATIIDSSFNRLNASFLVESSFTKELKNKRKLTTSLCFSYSPFNSFNGTYAFSNLGYASSGTIRQRPSYLSLKCSYSFWNGKEIPIRKKNSAALP